MNYWQVAAGSDQRDYSSDFIRFGLAFVGGNRQIATLREVAEGDRVILKRGMQQIVAAGTVVKRGSSHFGIDNKLWLRDFDGWNLNAYCHVEWHEPPNPVLVKGLTRSTIQRVWQDDLIREADKIIATDPARTQLDPEPGPTQTIRDEELIEHLIRNNFRISQAEQLGEAFRRIRRLANYYYQHCEWEAIKEHETRTFLVVPLLQALGWVEQQMKIEYGVPGGRVDLALFNEPFLGRLDQTKACVSLVETKGFSQGLFYAAGQGHNYAHQLPNCSIVSISNGFCYKVFKRANGVFPSKPSAYLNILTPRDRYPLDPSVPGCLEALDLLMEGL